MKNPQNNVRRDELDSTEVTAKLDRSGHRRSSEFKDPSATSAVIGGLLERAASASVYETFHAGESKRWLAHLREREKGPTDEQFAVLEDGGRA